MQINDNQQSTNDNHNYDNRRSYNNLPLQPGECLVPIRVDWEMVKHFNMCQDNLETWHIGPNKVLVAFAPVAIEAKAAAIKNFYRDLREYFASFHTDDTLSLDQFLEEHPDGAYHGARGTIALTGYNGILGYRTDIAYKTRENLTADQQAWLDANPDFDYDKECEEAKKVADAIKADGWKFASHTWGHIRIGDASLESIQKDTEKWLSYVAPLVGGTDTIIFAHGQDLADWHDYSSDNAKFAYLKSQGFNFFCNVDSSQYFLQIRDNYVRQGRRNLDGYRLWNDVHGEKNRTSDLFDATQILDPARTDMPAL